MTPQHRKIDKAIELRSRLAQQTGGIAVPFPQKPKRMRWHTYLRLRAQGTALEKEIWATERKRMRRYFE